MKTLKIYLGIMLFTVFAGCGEVQYTANEYGEPTYTFEELDNYGSWINVSSLGDVWRPQASYDWQPYSSGEWEWTDQGWVWDSDEPYGWIVYHYGYWAFDNSAGWVWVPDYQWSPSRVDWIVQDDYVGWAPLPPPGWQLPEPYQTDGGNAWIIVRSQDFANHDIIKYRSSFKSNQLTSRDWRGSNRSPDVDWIQKTTNHNYTPIKVETDKVKSRGGRLTKIRRNTGNRNGTGQTGMPVNPIPFTPPPVSTSSPTSPGQSKTDPSNTGRTRSASPGNTQPGTPQSTTPVVPAKPGQTPQNANPSTPQRPPQSALPTTPHRTPPSANPTPPQRQRPDDVKPVVPRQPEKPAQRNPDNRPPVNQSPPGSRNNPVKQKPVRVDRPVQKPDVPKPVPQQPVKTTPPPAKDNKRDAEPKR
jgi:hypothetical protein